MKNVLKLLALLLTFASGLQAQDKIYKTNGDILEAKVMEVNASDVKYKVFSNLNGPLYSIQKSQIIKIAYENGSTDNFTTKNNFNSEDLKRAQNVFVEIGAQGLLFSANYDTRFGNRRNGIGGRVGVGVISADDVTVVTIPLSLNYLLGNGKNFFEIGLGATYASLDASSDDFFGSGDAVIGTMAFMYRLQPENSGFSFRGGFTPIFNSSGFIPYYAGISLGYTF